MSRRVQIIMSPDEIRGFLGSEKTLILVSNGRGGFPHPMPMWFVADDDGSIRMTTFKKSQKVYNLRRDPRVTLLIESGETYEKLKGVALYAHAELVEDPDLISDTLLRAAGNDLDAIPASSLEEMRKGVQGQVAKRIVIRCKPDRVVSWDHGKLDGVY